MRDLESEPDLAVELCRGAFDRLARTVADLTDVEVAAPSRLPGWTVGHVLTHLARNADAHARRLAGALAGEDVPKYAGGGAQRASEIEAGAGRPAAELAADLMASQRHLDDLFTASAAAGWPDPRTPGATGYGAPASPAHRLREVEMHHVDLGLGYTQASWSEAYADWELTVLLSTVPARLGDPGQRRDVTAWLAGRGTLPRDVSLDPWV